jgi:hypothetical protein
MTRLRHLLPRTTFLLAGITLAALIANGFLWYAAGKAPQPPLRVVQHRACGQPVMLRGEDYVRWGSTRGQGVDLALLDFCDPVRVRWSGGQQEVWFWLEATVTGQVFPYAGWGYPWQDVETPFPGDNREPRNPWWAPLASLRAVSNQIGYAGGDGLVCPFKETNGRGLNLFFYREEGFQLPVGTTHSGWVCVYFDNRNSLPNAFTVNILPDRARITQWVDKLIVVRDEGLYDEPAIPAIPYDQLCDFARRTHPDTIRPGGACDTGQQ